MWNEYYIKYPKTYHLPFSESVNNDDKVQHDLSGLDGEDVVVTVKMDGENSTIYTDYYHARSLSSQEHWTRKKMYELQKKIGRHIPEGWRICGENLYAKHSIAYDNLPDYFLMFSIWDENNICLSWDETKEWAYLLDLHLVPVLYEGKFSVEALKQIQIDTNSMEGYVVRPKKSFHYDDFQKYVLKWVRKNHVQTEAKHWLYSNSKIETNKLA